MPTTVRSLSETSKRTAYMQVLFDVSERERTVVTPTTISNIKISRICLIVETSSRLLSHCRSSTVIKIYGAAKSRHFPEEK